jgi:porin
MRFSVSNWARRLVVSVSFVGAAAFGVSGVGGVFAAAGENEPIFIPVESGPSSGAGGAAITPDEPSVENKPLESKNINSDDPFVDPFAERNFDNDVLVLRADHLFGDWCGYRTQLEAGGITPSLSFVSDMLGNPVGGLRHGFTEADNLGFSAVFDLEKLYCVDGGSFLVSMSQRSGASLSAIDIGNTFTTQQVFGGPTFKVIDLAYKQTLQDDDVEFQIGRIAAGDDFLVSPYDYVFVQNGFCGNPVGIFINSPGMSGYPNATWGSLLKLRPTERTYVMGGVYNGDPTIRDLDNHGLDMSLNGPAFVIAEAAYQTNQLKGDRGLPGNYKIGSWWDGNDFAELETQALATANPGLAVPTHEGNYGFYGLFDQVLVKFSGPGEEIVRGLGVVGSVVVAPDQSISQMPYFFTAGVAARGLDRCRPRDVGAFGVVFGEFSGDLRRGQRQAQQIDPTIGVQDHETALEWTYIFRFMNGAYFVQPDMQYIIRPGGTGEIPNALVLGTQVGVNF